jgi:chlorite dismutase
MTTLVPGVAEQHTPAQTPTVRQYIRYLFYKASPSWRRLGQDEREAARSDTLAAIEPYAERLPVVRAYSTLGTRADADFLLWTVSERLEDFQELQAAILRSAMGAHLETP